MKILLIILLNLISFAKKHQTTDIKYIATLLKKINSDNLVLIDLMDCLYEFENEALNETNKQQRNFYYKTNNIKKYKQDEVYKKQKLKLDKELLAILDLLKAKNIKTLGINLKKQLNNILTINLKKDMFNNEIIIENTNKYNGCFFPFKKLDFLKLLLKKKYKKIILITSSVEVLELVESICNDLKIEFLGIHYNKKFLQKKLSEKEIKMQIEKEL